MAWPDPIPWPARTQKILLASAFSLILAIGIFSRAWEFGTLPPGLNWDEMATAVDAFSLSRYGMDRNGVSWPVHFTSFGNGQSTLYGYLLSPLVSVGGLTPFVIRLPALIAGILTLPLIYLLGKQLFGKTFGLSAMFVLAISPWHITISRWALESNLLPFTFAIGFFCLLKSQANNRWFILACVFFGASLYTYGGAYAALPVFLLLTLPLWLHNRRVSIKTLVWGLLALAVIATPIVLYVAINYFKLPSIRLGPVTIPRLPALPWFQVASAPFQGNIFQELLNNVKTLLGLLYRRTDAWPWNTVKPFGYFYSFTLPIVALGCILLLPLKNTSQRLEKYALFCWLAASLLIGVLEQADINRINLVFIPLFLFYAGVLAFLWKYAKPGLVIGICLLLANFASFTQVYHGAGYQAEAAPRFYAGLIPALEYARNATSGAICITSYTDETYPLFVILVEKTNPALALGRLGPEGPQWSPDPTRTIGRYYFRTADCQDNPQAFYILKGNETPPSKEISYKTTQFDVYKVYQP